MIISPKIFIAVVIGLSVLSSLKSQPKVMDDFKKFEQEYLHTNTDSIFVINFWATWCKPCVAELPYFEEVVGQFDDMPIKVKLISLDFVKQINSTLIPFVKKMDLKSEIVVIDFGDPNLWIDSINPDWSGSIPATIIFSKDKRLFLEKDFHSTQELKDTINHFLNN